MEHHFFNIEELPTSLKLINRKKNTENEKVNFRDDIKWIRVNEFGSYFYKTSYEENAPFKKVNILLKRPGLLPSLNMKLSKITEKTESLSQEKLDNIKAQLQFIDEKDKWFYEQFLESDVTNPLKLLYFHIHFLDFLICGAVLNCIATIQIIVIFSADNINSANYIRT